MIGWDFTIHLNDLLTIGGGFGTLVTLAIRQDRINNNLIKILGDTDEGLVYEVNTLKAQVNVLEIWKAKHEAMHEELEDTLEAYRLNGTPAMRERVSKIENQVMTVDIRLEKIDHKIDHLIEIQLSRRG